MWWFDLLCIDSFFYINVMKEKEQQLWWINLGLHWKSGPKWIVWRTDTDRQPYSRIRMKEKAQQLWWINLGVHWKSGPTNQSEATSTATNSLRCKYKTFPLAKHFPTAKFFLLQNIFLLQKVCLLLDICFHGKYLLPAKTWQWPDIRQIIYQLAMDNNPIFN